MKEVFKPKLFTVLKNGYSKQMFTKDLFAGIIVGIVALPLAIAFAVASGVSPEKGIITAIIAGFIISALGGSRVQIGGPTGAFIIIVYGIVAQYGTGGLIISTILAGILLIIFGVLKLGALLKFIPHPLIVGFTSGIALVIFSTQIKDALGLDTGTLPADFIDKWAVYFKSLSSINFWAVGITLGTIFISLFFRKITTKIPGTFVAIILMTAVVAIFKMPVTTIETLFGDIKGSFSFELPNFDFSNISVYFAPALTIAILGAIESLLSAVVADGMIGSNHRSNTELIAQGIANIVTPLFGGIPATGAIARTATNIKNGGRTPIAGIVHSITLLLIMLFLGSYAKLIPMSCLAGILIIVAYNMSEWRSFRSILRGSAFDIIILLTTFFLTVLVDLSIAIQIGVVLSAILFMKRMADNGQAILTDTDTEIVENYGSLPKGIEVYEISGPFFFGAAKHYAEMLKNHSSATEVIIIRMRHVPFIDATGIHNFDAVIKQLQSSNLKIILSGVQPSVRKELDKARISFLLGKANIFDDFNDALKHAKETIATGE
ncbi:MAG: sulfate permease [Bacteroidales bacterium]|nr:sulfate permease [Bacteroidales bacterium]MDD4217212.1 sulfate permease [Bacteroidales bacterium]MDY0141328.1 sulfate permease [Bacteroidales bacterium]